MFHCTFFFYSKEYYNVDLSAAPIQNIQKSDTQASSEADGEVEDDDDDDEEEEDHVVTRSGSRKKKVKNEGPGRKPEPKSEG